MGLLLTHSFTTGRSQIMLSGLNWPNTEIGLMMPVTGLGDRMVESSH